jgi:paraquat-inducible protein B
MSEPAAPTPERGVPALPEPVLARQNRLHLSLVWIVPIVAVIIGIVLVVRAVVRAGPEISIEFRSAEGIEPGRTEVRFKEVVVGRVKRVTLSPDRQKVRVQVGLIDQATSLAVQDTRFWVVRPRVGSGGVSGLSTLLSGSYIGVDAGESAEPRTEFAGLDTPPLVLRGEPGRSFVLGTQDLGSLDVGSPVYHRRLRVGRVVGYGFDATAGGLAVQIFVEAPHDRLVTQRTRFWNASGFDMSLTASGLALHTQSLATLIAGGVAFADASVDDTSAAATPAAAGQRFRLFDAERAAMAPDDGEPLRVRMVFKQPLRGLEAGAPVDLMGVSLGHVRAIRLEADANGRDIRVEVAADLYPRRLGALRERLGAAGADTAQRDRRLLQQLVERGLRAQARNGNLLTGQLYVALDFQPKAGAVRFDANAAVPLLPTVPGSFSELQEQAGEIVARLSKMPFDKIGSDLQGTLQSLGKSSDSLQATLAAAQATMRELTPEAQRTLAGVRETIAAAQQTLKNADAGVQGLTSMTDPQAPLQRSAVQAITELQRAAQALRVLADYLQRHPESLLRGKPPDALEAPK